MRGPRTNTLRSLAAVALGLVLVLALPHPSLGQPPWAAPPTAELTRVVGRVELLRKGQTQWAPAVVGDGVNVGARMESLNKEYQTRHAIIISESTYQAARDVLDVRRLGEAMVKGKTVPVVVYELLGLRERVQAEPVPVHLTNLAARA